MADPTVSSSRIFISYRRQDTDHAVGRLVDDLREHFAEDQVFLDIASIDPGADFGESLQRGLDTCAAVLVVIGPRWLTLTDREGRRRLDLPDDWVAHEVAESLKRPGVRVFPVLVDAEVPSAEELPEPLKPLTRRQAFPLTSRHWRNDVGRLIEFLKRVPDLGPTPAPAKPLVKATPVEPTAAGSGRTAGLRTSDRPPTRPQATKPSHQEGLRAEIPASSSIRQDRLRPAVSPRRPPMSGSTASQPQARPRWKLAPVSVIAVVIFGGVVNLLLRPRSTSGPARTPVPTLTPAPALTSPSQPIPIAGQQLDRRPYTVYVLGVPDADRAITAMQTAGYSASQYGPTGRSPDEFQVISIGAQVPVEVAQELFALARRYLQSLRYVVITEDRPDVADSDGTIGGRGIHKEISFAVTNGVLSDFRRVVPLSASDWQKLAAATDDETFHRIVRAQYQSAADVPVDKTVGLLVYYMNEADRQTAEDLLAFLQQRYRLKDYRITGVMPSSAGGRVGYPTPDVEALAQAVAGDTQRWLSRRSQRAVAFTPKLGAGRAGRTIIIWLPPNVS